MPLRLGAVGHLLGFFLLLTAGAMALPLALALAGQGDSPRPMLLGLLVTLLAGGALSRLCGAPDTKLATREAILTVVAAWVGVSVFGSLPFLFSPHFGSFTDAVFESTSGFTTTGATILSDVEVLPPSLQFWRHFTHWLGGMGIIMLGIAVLPLVGLGGKTLYHAQFAGAPSETLMPRAIETARALWRVYLTITVAEFLALRAAGMGSFDAICHTFSTLGTGGFSTRTASIAYYDSLDVELVLVVFMIVSSLNFATQYRMWVERHPGFLLRDSEIRFHASVLALATLAVAASVVRAPGLPWTGGLRQALFQVVSIGTTTGFVTADYERWHPFAQVCLLALMYFGGNTSSTAGGFKSFRMVLLLRVVGRAMAMVIHPRRIVALRVGKTVIPDAAVTSLLNLVVLALIFNFGASLALAASGLDPVTSLSAVPACMFSVGPALGAVGPSESYALLAPFAKWVLILTMLVGRVEFYTALVILSPAFWRR
jgi:trk system potassium uptake protein TrkH